MKLRVCSLEERDDGSLENLTPPQVPAVENKDKSAVKLFVSIEGLEATGKTTLVRLLAAACAERGIAYCLKPEFPNGAALGRITDALHHSLFVSDAFSDGAIPALFYMLYAEAISLSKLDYSADVVLADRYIESQAVYQGYFACVDSSFDVVTFLDQLETLYKTLSLPLADLTVVLHAPLAVIRQRLEASMRRSLTTREMGTLGTFDEYYRQIAGRSDRYVCLSSTLGTGSLVSAVYEILADRLAARS
ncbi:hypothetical protein FBQ96_01830 [Nitrospirales bacterium NOB]|nr:hypothetical protein [Nitrospirales bacterium NOB]